MALEQERQRDVLILLTMATFSRPVKSKAGGNRIQLQAKFMA